MTEDKYNPSEPICQELSVQTKLGLIPFSQIQPEPHKSWLIANLLAPGEFSVIYGSPKGGKTLIALDSALHVAFGWPWLGRQVMQSPVIYVAAEGGNTIKERIEAFRVHYKLADDYKAPLYLLPRRFLVMTKQNVADLIDDALLLGVKLIILDTVARTMVGHEENSALDMGLYVDEIDQIREATGAHVLVVHHAGKDVNKGGRGSNALLAAVDSEMQAAKVEDRFLLKDTASRGRESNNSIWFQANPVPMGKDVYGKAFSSIVVEAASELSAKKVIQMMIDEKVLAYLEQDSPIPKAKLKKEIGQISTGKDDAERKAWDTLIKRLNLQSDEYDMISLPPEETTEEAPL